MKPRFRLLHVEDDLDDAKLVARLFEKSGHEVAWTRAQTETEYRAALAAPPQAVLADYSLPQFSGLQALEILKQTLPDVPFILVSGTIGEEKAAEIMRLGASDYFLKERLARLPVAVERVVREAEQRVVDRTAKAEAEAGLRRLNRVHAVLSGVNSAIVRIRDRRELFVECCRVAVEVGRFVAAWIGIVDAAASVLKPVASAGRVRGILATAPLGLRSERTGYGLAGFAIRSKVPVLSNSREGGSSEHSEHMWRELSEAGIDALALIPLVVEGRAVGLFALYAAEAGFFIEDEMRLLEGLAGDISFALDHIEKAEQLEHLSYYDPVTGAPNRSLFHERLKLQLQDAARENARLALGIVDVERFKTINDTLGHHAGDALLRDIAGRFERSRHPASWFARIGADHFAVVVPEVASEQELARRIEKRLHEVFAPPFTLAGTELSVSARVGVAVFPADGADADALFRNAEAALKKAKATGERYLFYTRQMNERVAEKLSLENKLRRALERQEFVLHYQPKVGVEKREIVGVEALIRWRSPELGLVPPAKFVPLLEETGLILEVGSWALARAALDQRAWAARHPKAPRIAVNVSPLQLRQRDFVRVVEQAIAGAAAASIDLEITESLIMSDVEANIEKLRAVRDFGMSVAIDDFGTGYSSLAYLAKLPVQALKIDRAFIDPILDDADTVVLVQTIISMGRSMNLTVVAEGVETEDQAKLLRLLHCDEMQGHVFSKPLPQEELVAMLK